VTEPFTERFAAGLAGYGDGQCIEYEGRWFSGNEVTGYADAIASVLREAGVADDAPVGLVVRNREALMHIAEADSFLRAHTRFGTQPLDQAGRDGYVADMARIGAELGVPDPPHTEAELADRIARYRAELAATAQAREAARFLLLSPPLPALARAPYGMLAAAAVSLLPGWARRPLRLPRLPVTETVLVRPAGHAMVRAIRWATSAPPPVPL